MEENVSKKYDIFEELRKAFYNKMSLESDEIKSIGRQFEALEIVRFIDEEIDELKKEYQSKLSRLEAKRKIAMSDFILEQNNLNK